MDEVIAKLFTNVV